MLEPIGSFNNPWPLLLARSDLNMVKNLLVQKKSPRALTGNPRKKKDGSDGPWSIEKLITSAKTGNDSAVGEVFSAIQGVSLASIFAS
jgi:hypothetical protein